MAQWTIQQAALLRPQPSSHWKLLSDRNARVDFSAEREHRREGEQIRPSTLFPIRLKGVHMEREQSPAASNQRQSKSESASLTEPRVSDTSAGQPSQDYERSEFYNIHIDATLMDYLRTLGEDDVSKGVQIAGRFHEAMHKVGK
jgi:hypothetical protein